MLYRTWGLSRFSDLGLRTSENSPDLIVMPGHVPGRAEHERGNGSTVQRTLASSVGEHQLLAVHSEGISGARDQLSCNISGGGQPATESPSSVTLTLKAYKKTVSNRTPAQLPHHTIYIHNIPTPFAALPQFLEDIQASEPI